MTSHLKFLISGIVIFQLYLGQASASAHCGHGYYCYDRGSSNAYCCGKTLSGRPQCCYYTYFWSLWYFWFGIVAFFLLLSSCAACYRRRSRMRFQSRPPVPVATIVNAATAHVPAATAPYPTGQQNPNFVKDEDVPPSYQQVQQQGISAQYQEFAKQYPDVQSTGPQYPQQGYTQPQPSQLSAVPPYPGP